MKTILSRIALFVVMLWIVSLVIFFALRILPGDVAAIIAGTNSSVERYRSIRTQLGLDRPLIEQYGSWLWDIVRGNLGTSVITGQAMGERLTVRAAVTFPLIIMSMIITLAMGIPTAVWSVTSQHAWVRTSLRVMSQILGAIPALWAGLLLVMIFGKGSGFIGILPTQGFPAQPLSSVSTFLTACASLILPAVSVGIITAAQVMRYTRSALLDGENANHIAWSMTAGMTYAQAVRTTGLRLALPQIISVAGVTFASMITGVLTVETLFNIPGIATILLSDMSERDLPAVQTELLLLAAFFLLVGLVIDMLQRLIDPRLRAQQAHTNQ
ncbi:ABC transporter permease subunit [Alloscardovia theropitheci]|uniref:ABC transporter permease subunit n=1 Tax=Alloscardovia theropitheci TaxID=2496842 RepID=UPI0013F1625E